MLINEYLKASEKTERKFPEGMDVPADTAGFIENSLKMSEANALILDQLKKVLIYDKPIEEIESRCAELSEQIISIVETEFPENGDQLHLDKDRAEAFHALLGLVTEVHEVVPILLSYVLHGEELDIRALRDELGDLEYYKAILYRKFGIDEGTIRQANINKLAARYPGKFSSSHALNRNKDAEAEAMA